MNINARASRMPLAMACPGSLNFKDDSVSGYPARLGSAVHELMEMHQSSSGRSVPEEAISKTALDFHVDVRELGQAFRQTVYAMRQIEPMLPGGERVTELELQHNFFSGDDRIAITGHIDLAIIPDRNQMSALCIGSIVDYKTGWGDYDSRWQMMTYACLLMAVYRHIEVIEAYVVRPRLGTFDKYVVTSEEAKDVLQEIGERITLANLYVPGPDQCGKCGHVTLCPSGRTAMITNVGALSNDWNGKHVDKDQFIDMVLWIQAIEAQCKKARGWIKSAVIGMNGSIKGQNHTLELVNEDREVINYAKAKDVLLKHLGQDKIDDLLSISKEDLMTEIKASQKRGQKGKAEKALLEELDNAGAVDVKTIEKMVVKPIKFKPEQQLLTEQE